MDQQPQKLRVLDLFSGIGGFSLGLERTGGFETVAFCEIEEFPRKVLAKHWPEVPCFEDVRSLKGSDVGTVGVVCGGYPCQPFSTAGKRRGKEDDRHLWPEFSRLVAELRPSWVIGENVAGHISMGLDDVLSDLEGQGYTCRTFVIPACAVGAHHRRDRCWTIAHSGDFLQSRELDPRANRGAASGNQSGNERQGEASHGERIWPKPSASASMVAHPESERRGEEGSAGPRRPQRSAGASSTPKNVADTKLQQRQNAGTCGSDQGADQHAKSVRCESDGKVAGCSGADAYADCGNAQRFQSGGNDAENRQVSPPGSVGLRDGAGRYCQWAPEPIVGRVAHGVPNRVDRLKALGNAVVPQIPEMIGRAILEAERAA